MYYQRSYDSEIENWYEPDFEPEHSCSRCEEKEQKLDRAAGFLENIVQQLYSKDALDLSKLEDSLDELCYILDVKIGKDELQIERRKERSNPFYFSLAKDLLTLQTTQR